MEQPNQTAQKPKPPKPTKPPKPSKLLDPPILITDQTDDDVPKLKKPPPKPKLDRGNSQSSVGTESRPIPKPPLSRSTTPRQIISRTASPLPPTPHSHNRLLSSTPPPIPAPRSPMLRIEPEDYLGAEQERQNHDSSPMLSKGSTAYEWVPPPPKPIDQEVLEPSTQFVPSAQSVSAHTAPVPPPRSRDAAPSLPVRHPPPLQRTQTLTIKQKVLSSFNINHHPPTCNVNLPFDQVVGIYSVNEQCTLVCTTGSMTLIADDLEPIWESSDYNVSCCVGNEDRLWIGMHNGLVACIDLKDGHTLFLARTAHTKSVAYIWVDEKHQAVISLSQDGKALIWRASPGDFDTPPTAFRTVPTPISSALYHSQKLYVTTKNSLYVYDPLGPSLYLTPRPIELPSDTASSTRQYFNCMATDGLTLICGHNDGTLSTFDLESFQPIFTCKTGINAINAVTAVDDMWWLGLSSGSILVIDPRESQMLKEWKSASSTGSSIPGVKSLTRIQLAGKDLVVTVGAGTALWDAKLQSDRVEREDTQRRATQGTTFERNVRIFSWNVDSRNPETMAPELVRTNCMDGDILVFGLQEVVELSNKTKTAKKMASGGDQTEHKEFGLWKRYLCMSLGNKYDLVFEKALVGLYMIVFSRTTETKVTDFSLVKTGMGGLHGNKGGISVSLDFEGTTISLINCHLAAGHTQIIQRNRDAAQILDTIVGGLKPLEHDYCFFFGDTNYRINTARELAVKYIKDGDFERLASLDQLNGQKRKNPTFVLNALEEKELLFAPTYKFDRNSDRYDSSEKKRVPAWCDRILYRGGAEALSYTSIACQYSDHRPVTGLYSIKTHN